MNIRRLYAQTAVAMTLALSLISCEPKEEPEQEKPSDKKTEINIGGDDARTISHLWLGEDQQGYHTAGKQTEEPKFHAAQYGYNVSSVEGYITNNPDSINATAKVVIIFPKKQLNPKSKWVADINFKATATDGKYLASVENTDQVIKSIEFQSAYSACVEAPELPYAGIVVQYKPDIEIPQITGTNLSTDSVNQIFHIQYMAKTLHFAQTYSDGGYYIAIKKGNTETKVTAKGNDLYDFAFGIMANEKDRPDTLRIEMNINRYRVTKCSGLYQNNRFNTPGPK